MSIEIHQHVEWNTLRGYSLEGQKMEAWVVTKNGTTFLVFWDHTRCLYGSMEDEVALGLGLEGEDLKSTIMDLYDHNRLEMGNTADLIKSIREQEVKHG